MMSATIYATPVWKRTTASACFQVPSSLFVAAKAATQGIYSTVKHKNAKADTGVNIVIKAALKFASEEALVKMVKVETTLSFAVTPVIKALEARQSPNPTGLNRTDKAFPMTASIDCEAS